MKKIVLLIFIGFVMYSCNVGKNENVTRLGNFQNRPRGFNAANIPGGQVALFIPNKLKQHARIQNVRFYIGKKGNFKKTFSVQLYLPNSQTAEPDSMLLNEPVLVNNVTESGWHKVNLEKYKLIFPESGIFASMVWMPEAKYTLLSQQNCQYLAYSKAVGKLATWYCGLDNNWYQLPDENFNTMISMDIETDSLNHSK